MPVKFSGDRKLGTLSERPPTVMVAWQRLNIIFELCTKLTLDPSHN